MKTTIHVTLQTAALTLCASLSSATVLFQDDFEASLSQWTGKSGGAHSGVIVSDPLAPANKVLTFTGLNFSGDIFTQSIIPFTDYSQVFVEFRYLGLAQAQSVPDNFGGFFGVALNQNPSGNASWIAGTDTSAANGLGFQGDHLLDDSNWHSYHIEITPILTNNNINAMFLMMEDWGGAGGVAGDAYFDDIKVTGVPEPTSLSLLLLGSLAVLRRRSLRTHERCARLLHLNTLPAV